MSNISNNRISADVSKEIIAKVKSLIAQVNDLLPFLVGLNSEERQSILKISVANKAFVEDAVTAAMNNPSILPEYIDVKEMARDLNGYIALDELVILANQLSEKMRDTQMVMGGEAFASALTIYKLLGAAAEVGVPGTDTIYSQLKARFAGQGNFKVEPNETNAVN